MHLKAGRLLAVGEILPVPVLFNLLSNLTCKLSVQAHTCVRHSVTLSSPSNVLDAREHVAPSADGVRGAPDRLLALVAHETSLGGTGGSGSGQSIGATGGQVAKYLGRVRIAQA